MKTFSFKGFLCLNKKAYRCMIGFAVMLFSTARLPAQIPVMNSWPSAKAVIYLDFDGQIVQGTAWNHGIRISAESASLSVDEIENIFERVSEDFRSFNINITTSERVYDQAPYDKRIRIIMTPTHSWYGNAAGSSFVGSFHWGDNTPAWVFTDMLGNDAKKIAAAASHEIGHSLGLQHQSIYDDNGSKLSEFNSGNLNRMTGWAPIMGANFYSSCTSWITGSSNINRDSIQSDVELIAGTLNGFGIREDDYGNDQTNAENIRLDEEHFSLKGILNGHQDKDAFRLVLSNHAELLMQGIFFDMNQHGNQTKDILVDILGNQSDTIGHYQLSKLVFGRIDLVLRPGIYFLIVHGSDKQKNSNLVSYYALSGSLVPEENFKRLTFSHEYKALSK